MLYIRNILCLTTQGKNIVNRVGASHKKHIKERKGMKRKKSS